MINVAGLKGHTMAGHDGLRQEPPGNGSSRPTVPTEPRDVHPSIAVRSYGNRVGSPAAQAMGSYNGWWT